MPDPVRRVSRVAGQRERVAGPTRDRDADSGLGVHEVADPHAHGARYGGRQPARVEPERGGAKSGMELERSPDAADRLRGLEHEHAASRLA